MDMQNDCFVYHNKHQERCDLAEKSFSCCCMGSPEPDLAKKRTFLFDFHEIGAFYRILCKKCWIETYSCVVFFLNHIIMCNISVLVIQVFSSHQLSLIVSKER